MADFNRIGRTDVDFPPSRLEADRVHVRAHTESHPHRTRVWEDRALQREDGRGGAEQ